ncbi:hypothetical protein V6Z12_D08G033900 [Gossypium hirsutum]
MHFHHVDQINTLWNTSSRITSKLTLSLNW